MHNTEGAMAVPPPLDRPLDRPASRASNPVVKVSGLAWLEFSQPDLHKPEAFARAFGFSVVERSNSQLILRGADSASPCTLISLGSPAGLVGIGFVASERSDLAILAAKTGASIEPLPPSLGGEGVKLVDPTGHGVTVASGLTALPSLPTQAPLVLNSGHIASRVNCPQRPARVPARVQRLGHVVLQARNYSATLEWYLSTLGLIVSDFLYFPGQARRGSAMSFIRCDQGPTPVDHHTLALVLGPTDRYVHSAYEVADLDALAAGGEYLAEQGYKRSWGIGRHIQGSQIFDYWRDRSGLLFEHYTDGDLFDSTIEPGWNPLTASGLAQWGPPPTKDFLGLAPGRESLRELRAIVGGLRSDYEFGAHSVSGLIRVALS